MYNLLDNKSNSNSLKLRLTMDINEHNTLYQDWNIGT